MHTIYRCTACGAEDRDKGTGSSIPADLVCYNRRHHARDGIMVPVNVLTPEQSARYVLASPHEERHGEAN